MVNDSGSFLRRIVSLCLLAGLPSGLAQPAYSQEQPSIAAQPQGPAATAPAAPASPKIGLVLEGGGALGLAHIGVIRWLEEHHIPVSYIAGTSMGGLVGGVYATGRSPDEVEELVQGIKWNDVLRGQTPFKYLTYRRKEDASQYPGNIEFGLRKGLQFPEGFNSGQEVTFILDRVSLPYSTIGSFDNLPIPFACVGTDLVTAKQFVFRSGSLTEALRSTMSLPGLFNPVREDGHIFADGGLLDNLPVDVAKQMGADVVLAVHLEAKPMDANEYLSSFGVLGRSISVMIAANEMRSIEQADLLVSVPVQKFTTMDYSQGPALIKTGYDAAQSRAAVLTKFSVDDATWRQYLADRTARRREAPVPQFVEVTGTDKRSAKAIQKEIDPQIDGKPVDVTTLQEQILGVQGDGRYSTLNYSMMERNGKPGLLIQAEEKSYSPPSVRPFILIDGSDTGNVLFSIGARITSSNVGGYGSEWRNDFALGAQYGLTSEYFRPLRTGSSWFVAPRIVLNSSEFNAFTDNGRLGSIYREQQAGGGFDIGYQLGRSSEFRLGYQGGYYNYTLQVGETTEPQVSGIQGFTRFQYKLVHTDDPVIPTRGQNATFRTQWFNSYPDTVKVVGGPTISLGSTQHFPLTEASYTQFLRVTDRTSIFGTGAGGTIYGTSDTSLPLFRLGGPSQFAAYGNNEILANEYVLGQVGFLRELKELTPILGSKLYFEGRFEIGTFEEIGTGLGSPAKYRVPGDLSGGVVVNTIFGPVLLGGAVGDAGHRRFFFGLGKIF